jgi:hypothetical protein
MPYCRSVWVPANAEQLEIAAASGDLVETATFDGKLSLPTPKRNASLAIDVAAMSTDGGVLVYGLGEDQNDRLTVTKPFPLAGVADRVAQIVETSIAEPPFIEARPLELPTDPSRGYLLVVVPQSARAPHQVIVGGDLRFYGRGARGNRILTEAEVARLYRRRERWELDANSLLEAEIERWPYSPVPQLGYMFAFVRPLAADDEILERATEHGDGEGLLRGPVQEAMTNSHTTRYDPKLARAPFVTQRGAYGWTLSTASETERVDPANTPYTATLDVDSDGTGHLFVGRAAEVHRERLYVLEVVVAGNLAAFLAGMGVVYDRAGYAGQVDVGVAVMGIGNSLSLSVHGRAVLHPRIFRAPDFKRTGRFAAAELSANPRDVALGLVRRLIDATAGRDYDPLTA